MHNCATRLIIAYSLFNHEGLGQGFKNKPKEHNKLMLTDDSLRKLVMKQRWDYLSQGYPDLRKMAPSPRPQLAHVQGRKITSHFMS